MNYLLVAYVTAIIFFHELGHYLMARYYGTYGGIRLIWWCAGIEIKCKHNVTIREKINIHLAGIFLGFLLILPLKSFPWALIYLAISAGDLVILGALISAFTFEGFSKHENIEGLLIRYGDGIL